jgi:hypothetical protein
MKMVAAAVFAVFMISVFGALPFAIDLLNDAVYFDWHWAPHVICLFAYGVVATAPLSSIVLAFTKRRPRARRALAGLSLACILVMAAAAIYSCLYERSSFYYFSYAGEAKGHLSFMDVRECLKDEAWMNGHYIPWLERYPWRIAHMELIAASGLVAAAYFALGAFRRDPKKQEGK